MFSGFDRQLVFFRVFNRHIPGERQIPYRGDTFNLRVLAGERHFETYLVITFPGATMSHGIGTKVFRYFHQVFTD